MLNMVRQTALPIARRAWERFQSNQGPVVAAGLAYYALFSLFPLLLVTLSVLGFAAGPDSQARGEILRLASESLPPDAYATVLDALASLSENRGRVGLIGFATLLFGASRFFGALDRAFDAIWGVPPRAAQQRGIVGSALAAARERAAAFGLVLACVLLLLVSTLASLALGVAVEIAQDAGGDGGVALAQLVQVIASLAALTLVLALIYRTLPDAYVAWGDVWPAAILAALVFLALQRLAVSGVVNLGASYQGYGVIGGVMLLMFWLFLALQVLLLGAEVSHANAELRGSRRPERAAQEAVGAHDAA